MIQSTVSFILDHRNLLVVRIGIKCSVLFDFGQKHWVEFQTSSFANSKLRTTGYLFLIITLRER